MPTPHEIEIAKRCDALRRHGGDFYVQEVFECLSSDDSDAGEEDLPLEDRTSYKREQRAEAARVAREYEQRRARERELGKGAVAAAPQGIDQRMAIAPARNDHRTPMDQPD